MSGRRGREVSPGHNVQRLAEVGRRALVRWSSEDELVVGCSSAMLTPRARPSMTRGRSETASSDAVRVLERSWRGCEPPINYHRTPTAMR